MYDSCDYFVYLDAKNNRYNMIRGQVGTPLLPEVSVDYEQDLADYANTFVAEEDRETVLREMRLARVIDQIEQYGIHSLTYGVMGSKRGYTRKRLDYRYHDQKNEIILISRTDITDTYFAPISDKKQAAEIAQRICYAIHSVKISCHNKKRITGSVGIALAPEDGRDYDTLVHKADHNLYKAKKGGKNQYIF